MRTNTEKYTPAGLRSPLMIVAGKASWIAILKSPLPPFKKKGDKEEKSQRYR